MNDEESFVRSYSKERNEFCKAYTTLEDLDFEVESIFMNDKVRGIVYCQNKDTKEPVWIVSRRDEGGSWWEVNRVSDFYKNQFWGYNNNGERKKYSYYVMKCPCCKEESNLGTYENIRTTKNSRTL